MSKQFNRKALFLTASGFGLGFSPVAPGTVGSLGGVALFFLFHSSSSGLQSLFFVIFCLLAIALSDGAERESGERDPEFIVVDEMAGMWATLFLLERSDFSVVILGLLLFRAFDILKFFPINLFEGFRGGVGIVADDVAAGMLANLLLRFVLITGVL